MVLLDSIRQLIAKYPLDEIYWSGVVDPCEDGFIEFTGLGGYLFLEFGKRLVKIQQFEQYSRLRITAAADFTLDLDLAGMEPAKARISALIFDNPLHRNEVRRVEFFNAEELSDAIECDTMKMKLSSGQELFLDPGYLSINIGGPAVERAWRSGIEDIGRLSSIVIEV